MDPNTHPRRIDYYPIWSFVIFWFFAGWSSALQTRDPRLFALSVVSLPALVVTALAVRAVRRQHRGIEAAPS